MKTQFPSPLLGYFVAMLTLSAWAVGAQAAAPAANEEPDEYALPRVSDPLAPMNRAIFRFNDGFYAHVLRPFARGYERVVPSPVRRGIGNFFDNIKFPVRFVSCLLQARPGRATKETGKFLINSTVGVAGLLRVSDSIPPLATVPAEDVGQALGTWGIGAGPYLVLPFLGPSSLRDTVGLAGNAMLYPVNWSATESAVRGYDSTWRYSLQAVDFMNSSPDQLSNYDGLKRSAVDPYVSVRDGYLQYRTAAVKK